MFSCVLFFSSSSGCFTPTALLEAAAVAPIVCWHFIVCFCVFFCRLDVIVYCGCLLLVRAWLYFLLFEILRSPLAQNSQFCGDHFTYGWIFDVTCFHGRVHYNAVRKRICACSMTDTTASPPVVINAPLVVLLLSFLFLSLRSCKIQCCPWVISRCGRRDNKLLCSRLSAEKRKTRGRGGGEIVMFRAVQFAYIVVVTAKVVLHRWRRRSRKKNDGWTDVLV